MHTKKKKYTHENIKTNTYIKKNKKKTTHTKQKLELNTQWLDGYFTHLFFPLSINHLKFNSKYSVSDFYLSFPILSHRFFHNYFLLWNFLKQTK